MKKDYVITRDKCLIHTDSPLLEGWETCPDVKTLMAFAGPLDTTDKGPSMRWKGSKCPNSVLGPVLGTIAQFPKTETAYSLYYNNSTSEWAIKCPKQYGTAASVTYKDDGDEMPEGFGIIGSIHTHPEMGAFWSGTDMNDQKYKHGVHIVFGLRNGKVSAHLVTIFTKNGSYNQNFEDIFEPVDFNADYAFSQEWVDVINAQELKPTIKPFSPKTWRYDTTQYQYQYGVPEGRDYPYKHNSTYMYPGMHTGNWWEHQRKDTSAAKLYYNGADIVHLRKTIKALFDNKMEHILEDVLMEHGVRSSIGMSYDEALLDDLDYILTELELVDGEKVNEEFAMVMESHGWVIDDSYEDPYADIVEDVDEDILDEDDAEAADAYEGYIPERVLGPDADRIGKEY